MIEDDVRVEVDGIEIEIVNEYIYLGQAIAFGKQNQALDALSRFNLVLRIATSQSI